MPAEPSEPFHEGPEGWAFDPAQFDGVARLFPLPGVSLFPRVVLPLHIFEERYRELMQDALDGDRLIAMAVLKPGWEQDYASRPPLEPHACLGRIVAHHQLDDGRFNLMLAGVARVKILSEIEPPRAFRRARVELVEELEPSAGDPRIAELQSKLSKAFRQALPAGEPPEPLQKAFHRDTPLGLLADLAGFTLPLATEVKQQVLAEADVLTRAQLLIRAIEQSPPITPEGPSPGTPPPFSMN